MNNAVETFQYFFRDEEVQNVLNINNIFRYYTLKSNSISFVSVKVP